MWCRRERCEESKILAVFTVFSKIGDVSSPVLGGTAGRLDGFRALDGGSIPCRCRRSPVCTSFGGGSNPCPRYRVPILYESRPGGCGISTAPGIQEFSCPVRARPRRVPSRGSLCRRKGRYPSYRSFRKLGTCGSPYRRYGISHECHRGKPEV